MTVTCEHVELTSTAPGSRSKSASAVVLALLVTACGGATAPATPAPVPFEFSAACGHSGAIVELKRVPVVVPHARCDLTGVVVRYRGIGVTIPQSGTISAQGDSPAGGHSLTATVDAMTRDVTIRE